MIRKYITPIVQNETTQLFIVITAVNAGNYLLNLLLGRFLGPADFAEAGILATSVLILSFIAIGIQMTAAKYSAGMLADNKVEKLAGLQTWARKGTVRISLLLAVVLIFMAHYLQEFLHFRSSWPLLLIIIGIPAYFLMSARRGFLQGQQQFRRFAGSFVAEMISRLVVTVAAIALVWYLGGTSFSEAVAIGFLASFLAALWWSKSKEKPGKALPITIEKKGILAFFAVMMAYEGTQIIISYSDIILVKHFFTNHEAGLYAALSLIGRIVYFGTWAVVMTLVPKVVQRAKKGLPHHKLFQQAITILLAVGTLITAGSALFPSLIVKMLFGQAYLEIGMYLWKYSAATTLFACANVFAYYHLSLGRYVPVILSAIAGFFQILLITFYHENISTIIHIQMVLMTGLVLSMITFHLVKNYRHEKIKSSSSISIPA